MGQKNSAGKYRGRVQIGIGKNGKPINKYVSASIQRELEQKKAEIRHYYVDGQPRQKDRLFYEYAAEWYELKKQPFISMASQRSYSVAFNKHVLLAFGTHEHGMFLAVLYYLGLRRGEALGLKCLHRVHTWKQNNAAVKISLLRMSTGKPGPGSTSVDAPT